MADKPANGSIPVVSGIALVPHRSAGSEQALKGQNQEAGDGDGQDQAQGEVEDRLAPAGIRRLDAGGTPERGRAIPVAALFHRGRNREGIHAFGSRRVPSRDAIPAGLTGMASV